MQDLNKFKIGLIGHGFIGSNLLKLLRARPQFEVEASFVLSTNSANKSAEIPFVSSLSEGLEQGVDLVVEAATPNAYASYALQILETTTKPPTTLKLAESSERKLVFEGSTREVCKLFPRSVNSHAAVALSGIGFDRQVSRVYADPTIKTTKQSIEAIAKTFSISISRESQLVGVSGTGMIEALMGSILKVAQKSGVAIV